MDMQIKIPMMGENVKEGQIVHIPIKVGDVVTKGQAILELETGKATVDIPTPAGGKIAKILVAVGDRVEIDQVVVVLVTEEQVAQKEVPKVETSKPPVVEAPKGEVPQAIAPQAASVSTANTFTSNTLPSHVPVAAAPSVRLLARELGVELSQVASKNKAGKITIEDVKAHVKASNLQPQNTRRAKEVALPNFAAFGVVKHEPMSTIRMRTAEHMALCWETIPHVTQHATASVNGFEKISGLYFNKKQNAEVKITLTAYLVKIIAELLKTYPKFNASIDMKNNTIIYKEYINIGVAVDTEKGLLVPVIKNANQKSLPVIAQELSALANKARAGKLSLDDMSGGTFTITNLGSLGGSFFTPIINSPEVAILGVGRADPLLPLSLSYDHRLIDGADGARFITALTNIIEEPANLMFLQETR